MAGRVGWGKRFKPKRVRKPFLDVNVIRQGLRRVRCRLATEHVFERREGKVKSQALGLLKSGVEKTTLTGNVGRLIADKGLRVLLVDKLTTRAVFPRGCCGRPQITSSQFLQGNTGLESATVPLGEPLAILPSFGMVGRLKDWTDRSETCASSGIRGCWS